MIVYSSQDRDSFTNLEEFFNLVKNHALESVKVILVENRFEGRNEVHTTEGEELAISKNIRFVSVNAATDNNIEELFNVAIDLVS